MRIAAAAILAVSLVATPLAAQDHQSCPLHQAHRTAAVDHRHQQETGLPSDGIVHHFLLSDDGGSIRLEVKDARRTDDRDRVRGHLQTIARAFAAGDFSLPARIHDRVPPGVEGMKARQDAIRYTFAETPGGGTVTIASTDAAAVEAIHDFLRFQIDDHATGDPVHH